jgi:hypothetical protein
MNKPPQRWEPVAVAALFFVTLITLIVCTMALTACDPHKQTITCKDGSTSSGTNVNKHFCDKHGGRAR